MIGERRRSNSTQVRSFCDGLNFQGRVVSTPRLGPNAPWRCYMAKHSQGDTPEPTFKIDSTNWRRIEKAYGASLPPNVQESIVGATEAFLFLQSFERTTEPLAKVKVILEAHDKAATRFFNELFGGPSSFSDAGVYAHYLIDNNFGRAKSGSEKVGLDAFLDFLRAFHIACNSAIKQLSDPSTGQSGDAWNSWISRLSEILETHKSLASFVWALQHCLPPECRRDLAVLKE